MSVHNSTIHKICVYSLIMMLLGIFGIINSIPVASTTESDENFNQSSFEDTTAESRATKITDYLDLWDVSVGPELSHDGEFGNGGSGDPYTFYLDKQGYVFSLWLKNIMTEGVMEYVNTTISVSSGGYNPIIITDIYANDTNVGFDTRDQYTYGFDIGTSGNIDTFYNLDIDVNMVILANAVRYERSGTINIKIKLTSRLTVTGGGDLELAARNNNFNPVQFFSGTKDRLLTIPNIYSRDGNFDDVEFKLNIPASFSLDDTSATLSGVTTNAGTTNDPFWLLNDAGALDAAPQVYTGSFELSYYRNDIKITEFQNPILIEIVDTPLLSLNDQIPQSEIGFVDTGGEFISNIEIYQGTMTTNFSIMFKNDGNYDLTDVEVELFTDNAAYFFKSKYYYDENNNAFKNSISKTVPLGNIDMGQTMSAEFPTEIIKNLPPGLYKIPVKYSANYNTGGIVDDDINEGDIHANVVAARSLIHEAYTPFLLVKVNEGDDANDNSEPDLLAISPTYLRVGMHNVPLEIELTNLENYQINSVNVKIAAGGSSPLQQLNSQDRTAIDIYGKEIDFIMFAANDPVFSNKNTVNFFVDVYKNAAPGVYSIPITVTSLDPFNQERTTEVNVDLNINPVPPSCIITDAVTGDIKPNKNFTLTLTVHNIGGSDAENVSLIFNGSTNLFSAEVNTQGPQTIKQNEYTTFVFDVLAGEVEAGLIYTTSLFISYEDSLGNIYQFNANPEQKIPLFVKGEDPPLPPPPPPIPPKFIITDITATEIIQNGFFTLTVKVFNCGGSTARNVTVMFNGTSNLFSTSENLLTVDTMAVNEEKSFEFIILTGDIEPGTIYEPSIGISFIDTLDVSYPFDPGNEHPLELRSKVQEPEPEEEKFLTQEVAVVFLGVFILISALIFSLVNLKLSKKGEVKKKEEEATLPPEHGEEPAGPQPPPQPREQVSIVPDQVSRPDVEVFQPQQELPAPVTTQPIPPPPPPPPSPQAAAPTPAQQPPAEQATIDVPYKSVNPEQQENQD